MSRCFKCEARIKEKNKPLYDAIQEAYDKAIASESWFAIYLNNGKYETMDYMQAKFSGVNIVQVITSFS